LDIALRSFSRASGAVNTQRELAQIHIPNHTVMKAGHIALKPFLVCSRIVFRPNAAAGPIGARDRTIS
jgi:hypothetical protein